jgi:predicted DNA-binding transcriptional regulator YafY
MYQSFNARKPTEFILCPYLLKEFRNRWFLFGSKADDLKLYNLPLDRIKSVEPVDVPYRENPDFDSEHFFDNVIGVSKNINNKPRCIRFWANREQSHYIKTKPIHQSQQVVSENHEDGSCIFQIDVVINFEMYSVFMSYGSGIRIIYPRNAVMYMRDKFKEALDLYDAANE